jgi:hypothetical protein
MDSHYGFDNEEDEFNDEENNFISVSSKRSTILSFSVIIILYIFFKANRIVSR